MNTTRRLGFAGTTLAALLTTVALAQGAEDQASDQMMQGHDAMAGNMMGGEMSGMQGTMPMMQMTEACTEMMQAMTKQLESPATEPQDD